MWLLRWRTGLAMTVLVAAMQADSRGRVVGRGSGDCSCFTVVSYSESERQEGLFLLRKDYFHINPSENDIRYTCI